jgi:hypothetical protein
MPTPPADALVAAISPERIAVLAQRPVHARPGSFFGRTQPSGAGVPPGARRPLRWVAAAQAGVSELPARRHSEMPPPLAGDRQTGVGLNALVWIRCSSGLPAPPVQAVTVEPATAPFAALRGARPRGQSCRLSKRAAARWRRELLGRLPRTAGLWPEARPAGEQSEL